MGTEEREHPGMSEPQSYGRTHHENLDVDLNSASQQQLAELPMVRPEKAQAIINSRPFDDWSDLEKIPGFSNGTIDDLKSGGARISGGE